MTFVAVPRMRMEVKNAEIKPIPNVKTEMVKSEDFLKIKNVSSCHVIKKLSIYL